jgi:hypothetical protein
MLDEAIKRFCQETKLDYRKYNEDDIIKSYESLSLETNFTSIINYKKKFKNIFNQINNPQTKIN